MNRPGNPTELKLMDIAFGAVFRQRQEDRKKCPHCGKKLKDVCGVDQHIRDVHKRKAVEHGQ